MKVGTKDRTDMDSSLCGQRVTVVVCTYNRATILPDALQSLLRLDMPKDCQWDVLVVDNGSSDATAQVVADMRRGNEGRLHYVLEPEPGLAAARNCGIAHASGDWIVFFDDDQLADAAWLRELVEFALHNNIRVVGAALRLLLPAGAPDLPPEVTRLFAVGLWDQPHAPQQYFVGDGNSLFHRSVFEEVGVFDASLREGGQDTDLVRRIRKAEIAMRYQPRAIAHHRIAASRLETPALLAASNRVGWGFARRDYRKYGSLGLFALCCARIGLQTVRGSFRYVKATLTGDRKSLLMARIGAARTRGYGAATAAFILPESIGSRLNLGAPSFRDELGRTSSQAKTGQVQ